MRRRGEGEGEAWDSNGRRGDEGQEIGRAHV